MARRHKHQQCTGTAPAHHSHGWAKLGGSSAGPRPDHCGCCHIHHPEGSPHFACQMSRLFSAFQLHAEAHWAETRALLVIWKVGPVYFSSRPSPPATTRAHPRLKVTFPPRSRDISRGAHGSTRSAPSAASPRWPFKLCCRACRFSLVLPEEAWGFLVVRYVP